MDEMPWPVAVLLGSIFVAFGVGLGYYGRDIEPWAKRVLWTKCSTWIAFGLAVTLGHWSPGASTILITVALAARVFLHFRHRQAMPGTTDEEQPERT